MSQRETGQQSSTVPSRHSGQSACAFQVSYLDGPGFLSFGARVWLSTARERQYRRLVNPPSHSSPVLMFVCAACSFRYAKACVLLGVQRTSMLNLVVPNLVRLMKSGIA